MGNAYTKSKKTDVFYNVEGIKGGEFNMPDKATARRYKKKHGGKIKKYRWAKGVE